MNAKEKLEILRVIIASALLITAIYGMVNHAIGWGWFLFSGTILYPTSINIDFREHQ